MSPNCVIREEGEDPDERICRDVNKEVVTVGLVAEDVEYSNDHELLYQQPVQHGST